MLGKYNMKYQDKIAHFAVSFMLTCILSVFVNIYLASLIVLLVGIGKEIYDNYKRGGYSWKDILADIGGIILFNLTTL